MSETPSADDILKATTTVKRLAYEIEGAGKVWIHRLPACEARLLFNSMNRDEEGKIDDPYDDAKVIMRCVRDENGRQIFQKEHLTKIPTMGNDVVLKLVNACLEINGMTASSREDMAKNSGTTSGSDSSSV